MLNRLRIQLRLARRWLYSPGVRLDILIKTLGLVVIGLLSTVLLVSSLVAAGKKPRSGDRIKGLLFFTLAVIGLCTLLGFLAGQVIP